MPIEEDQLDSDQEQLKNELSDQPLTDGDDSDGESEKV